jgi:iron complex transport system permease protein
MMRALRTGSLPLAIALALLLAVLVGSTPMSFQRVVATLAGGGSVGDGIVLWEIRLPRALAALATGIALGACGAALQGLLRNPLAEPGVLGVSASAALSATSAIFFGLAQWSPLALPLSAIAGALAATAVLTAAALRVGSVVTLILVGVGLSSFAGALVALLMNLAPHPFSLSEMLDWMLGTVANRSVDDLALTVPFMALGLTLLLAVRRNLSVLALGEEAAAGAGVDLERTRLLVVTGAGIATGAAVALAGAIGFVGIVAPHLVRPFVGHDPARTLAPAALLGGLIVLLADVAVRVAPTASELKLGVVAALLGAPVFVWIVWRGPRLHG